MLTNKVQMVTHVTKCAWLLLFFTAFSCGKQNDNPSVESDIMPDMPIHQHIDNPDSLSVESDIDSDFIGGGADCRVSSFFKGVSLYFNCSDVFLIKGIVLDTHKKTGLHIRFTEDLKGNFPDNINSFIMWGANTLGFYGADNLTIYGKQDTLILLLTSAPDLSEITLPEEFTVLMKPEDYTTLTCTRSVVKLSGDYAIGHILPPKIIDDRKWSDLSSEEQHALLESWALNESIYIYLSTLSEEQVNDFLQSIFTKMHTVYFTDPIPLKDFYEELNLIINQLNK